MSDDRDQCSDQVCLVGGNNRYSGNVIIDGAPVCDDEWDLEDAAVVCRQLGFAGVDRATRESEFGTVSSQFAMDNVRCQGNETSLDQCRHKSGDDCDGHEAAGVVCSDTATILPEHCYQVP